MARAIAEVGTVTKFPIPAKPKLGLAGRENMTASATVAEENKVVNTGLQKLQVAFLTLYPVLMRFGVEEGVNADPVTEVTPEEKLALIYIGQLIGRRQTPENPLDAWELINREII